MIWKRPINISEDLIATASPILWACRLFGVAPLTVEKSKANFLIEWSLLLTIYSFAIGSTSVGSTIYAVFQNDESPDNASQSTTKYIIIMNWFVEQLAIVTGIFGAPFRFNNLYNFIKHVTEIDYFMPPINTKKFQKTTITALIAVVVCNTIFLSTKCYTMAKKYVSLKDLLFAIHETVSYSVVMILECQYWYMTSTIKRRIDLLNKSLIKVDSGLRQGKILTQKNVCPASTVSTSTSKLTKVYINLCNAVDQLNNTCGPFISIIIVIDLLRLTVTGYLLIVSLQTNFDVGYTVLIICTFLASFYRLVFIVEPCEDCVKQTRETSLLVCQLLCSDVEFESKQQLQVLYNQLLQRKIEFSAYGFGNVDRSLITTISATATLYLVAAVQFKISED